MRQFLLPAGLSAGSLHIAYGDDFHYLSHVLRLREGAEVDGRDPQGRRFRLALAQLRKDSVVLRVLAGPEGPAGDSRELEFFCCLPKPAKMDLIVRMACEAGVTRIVPVASEFSVIREQDLPRLLERRGRWEKIARSALQQSGRTTLPRIGRMIPFRDIPASEAPHDLSLFALETGKEIRTLHGLLGGEIPDRIRFLVGPEGGLSGRETAALVEKGFFPVGLGENILRTETAAVFLCAAIKILILEKNSWTTR